MAKMKLRKTDIPQMTPTKSADGYLVGWFREEVYGANIHMLWPRPGKKLVNAHLQAYYKRTFDLDYQGDTRWKARCTEIVSADGNQVAHCICLSHWELTPDAIATLAHEVFHAVEQIFCGRDLPHHPATSEAWAYLTESIQRRCLEMLMA